MDMKRGKREEDGGEAYLMKRSTGSTAVTAARCSPDPAPARPLKAARTGSRSSLAVGTGSRGLPARGPWSLPRLTADSQATRASHREREREARVKRVREAGVEREREAEWRGRRCCLGEGERGRDSREWRRALGRSERRVSVGKESPKSMYIYEDGYRTSLGLPGPRPFLRRVL
jgi:hypothetical protein